MHKPPLPPNMAFKLIKKADNPEVNKEQLFQELNARAAVAMQAQVLDNTAADVMKVEKMLVYYTINYNFDYVELFVYSIKSLYKHNDNKYEFDVLVITSEEFIEVLMRRLEEENVRLDNIYFHCVPLAHDGVSASMDKLKVFEWEPINVYARVLYLDADIIFRKPISLLFQLQLEPGILHASVHLLQDHLHTTPYHSIIEYDLSTMRKFSENKIHAFNAGQFMFLNCARMRSHFNNVLWLSTVWDGMFFFEQAYMNHYFNTLFISDVHVLLDKFKFMAVHLGERAAEVPGIKLEDAVCVHFAGLACDAAAKKDFIMKHHADLI